MAEGDSLSSTGPTPVVSYYAYLTLEQTWQLANVAIGGTTTAQMLARVTNVTSLFNGALLKNVALIWGGINDTGTAAQTWSNLASWSAACKAAGFKTIVTTLAGGNTWTNSVNAQIAANWVGVFDGLADIASNSNLGGANANQNTTYFLPDGIHLTDLSQQTIVTPIIQAAILAL